MKLSNEIVSCLLSPYFEYLYGKVYGCQFVYDSIYRLDMVAKNYLWWSNRAVVPLFDEASHFVIGPADRLDETIVQTNSPSCCFVSPFSEVPAQSF